jgi:uncharacterized protein YndB with AHSA1/START domain
VSRIEVDLFVAHPPTMVWRALPDPAMLARWLMPNDFVPVLGHRFTFRTDPVPGFDGIVACQVLEVDVETKLKISWANSAGLDTTVTWTLAPEGRGTRILLVHDGFDEGDPRQLAARQGMGGGWAGHLAQRLNDVLVSIDDS